MKQNEDEMDERIAIGDEAIFSGHEELESRKCSNKVEPPTFYFTYDRLVRFALERQGNY